MAEVGLHGAVWRGNTSAHSREGARGIGPCLNCFLRNKYANTSGTALSFPYKYCPRGKWQGQGRSWKNWRQRWEAMPRLRGCDICNFSIAGHKIWYFIPGSLMPLKMS